MSKEKVNVITLGCSKNSVDSERLLRQLKANDFTIEDDSEKADIVIINTCGFIEAAKEESINTILEAVEMKKAGKLKKVLVAGCLSERYKEELIKEIPGTDGYFGTEKYGEVIEALGGKLKHELLGERILSGFTSTAYLKISEGCDHPCSFCAIPIMRGKHISRTKESLIKEATFLAENNVKELIIIAQDTTSYGIDLYKKRVLSELLNDLSKIKGIEWIRVMYAYPTRFPEDLMNEINDNDKICKYIDIPLQHISDNVLKSMRRGITKDATKRLIDRLKNKIDGLVIRTTFITGYPVETEKDFNLLCDFVKEYEFDKVGVFTYSQEENTSGYVLGDKIPDDEKENRKATLMEIQKAISLKKNSDFVNKTLKVLLETKEGEFYVGRSYRDAPEVDGDVIVKNRGSLSLGKFYDVEINDFDEYDLYGKIWRKK